MTTSKDEFNIEELINNLPINYRLIEKELIIKKYNENSIIRLAYSNGYEGKVSVHSFYKPISKINLI